jgi:hypothetical protein
MPTPKSMCSLINRLTKSTERLWDKQVSFPPRGSMEPGLQYSRMIRNPGEWVTLGIPALRQSAVHTQPLGAKILGPRHTWTPIGNTLENPSRNSPLAAESKSPSTSHQIRIHSHLQKKPPGSLPAYCRPVLPEVTVEKLPTTRDPTIPRHSIPLM